MPLGDKRPSDLYHEMKRVAGNVLGEAALKGLWAQRLPEAARPVIAASSGPAVEFTRIADSIVDALAPHAIHQTTTAPLNELQELKAVIAALRTQIDSMPRHGRSRSRNVSIGQRSHTPANLRNDQPNTSSSTGGNVCNSNATTNADPELCWYHQKYGENARNCREPCRRFLQPRVSVVAATAGTSQNA